MCHVHKIEYLCKHSHFKPVSQCRGVFVKRSKRTGKYLPLCKTGGNTVEQPLKIKMQQRCPTCRQQTFIRRETEYIEHTMKLKARSCDEVRHIYYGSRVTDHMERVEEARAQVKFDTAVYAPKGWVPRFAPGQLPAKKNVGPTRLRYGFTAEDLATDLQLDEPVEADGERPGLVAAEDSANTVIPMTLPFRPKAEEKQGPTPPKHKLTDERSQDSSDGEPQRKRVRLSE